MYVLDPFLVCNMEQKVAMLQATLAKIHVGQISEENYLLSDVYFHFAHLYSRFILVVLGVGSTSGLTMSRACNLVDLHLSLTSGKEISGREQSQNITKIELGHKASLCDKGVNLFYTKTREIWLPEFKSQLISSSSAPSTWTQLPMPSTQQFPFLVHDKSPRLRAL